MFSSVFSDFTFRSMTDCELIFIYEMRCRSRFICLADAYPCCSNPVCWNDYPFSTKLPLYLGQKSAVCKCAGFSGLPRLFCWPVCLSWCKHTAGAVLLLSSFSKLFLCSRSHAVHFRVNFRISFVNFCSEFGTLPQLLIFQKMLSRINFIFSYMFGRIQQ